MKKILLTFAFFVMAICVNAQTNQYFWYQGNLMMGNPIAQIDSVTFGEGEPVDTLHIMLPRTIIKTVEVHDTIEVTIHDTLYLNKYVCLPEGAIPGEFSVSPTKKVFFSNGNLQYRASTDTWRFAEHQYDTIGAANQNASPTYSGWIDLFGWGTGTNPTNTSEDNSQYATFSEWGANAISNGGNTTNLWRTLSSDEWKYILHDRPNAEELLGFGTIGGIHGLIILPDDCNFEQISFTPSVDRGLVWFAPDSAYNNNKDNFTHNTYTVEEWNSLETLGAVFLPTAGSRYGTTIYDVIHQGSYWTTERAFRMRLHSNFLYVKSGQSPYRGQSVRLVQDVNKEE